MALRKIFNMAFISTKGKINPQFTSVCYVSTKNYQGRKTKSQLPHQKSAINFDIRIKRKLQERPLWLEKMHESLLSDASLPLPAQDKIDFNVNHLRSCTLDSLLSMVWNVTEVDASTKVLLIELWRRMDLMTVEQIISVADVFFINNVNSLWYAGAMTAYMMETMENTDFTPSQLTRLSFHIFEHHRSIPPGFCLILENTINRHFHLLTLNQLAVICHSFFNNKTRIRSMDLLDKISVKMIEEFSSLNNYYLPMFMKTLRFSNFLKISFYKELGNIIVEKDYLAQYRTLAQVMHIAYAFASIRITHSVLFSYLLKTCCHPRYNFRIKDLAKIIWASGTLVTDSPEDISALKKIMIYLEHNMSLKEALKHPDNLVDLICGLSFLNIYSDSLLDIFFHPKNIAAVIGMEKGNQKIPQLSIIDQSVRIEYPSYSGNLLDTESQDIIASLLGDFPVETEMNHKKGLRESVDALTEILGKDFVSLTRPLPHFASSDIILLWDSVKSRFIKHDEVDLDGKDKNGYCIKLAIVVLSNMQTSFDGKPMGMLHMKLRQLKALGFQPIVVGSG